jgi:hypothetical protein
MERRFLTTAVIPTLVFFTGYGVVLIASLSSFGEAAAWWSSRSTAEQLLAALVASAVVWFVAGLFSSNWRRIVRLYEGYPLWVRLPEAGLDHGSQARRRRWVRRLPGFAWHLEQQRRLSTGETKGGAYQAYARYAPSAFDHETLPTTIGNILLAGERYGLDRYGLDPTVLWPRFYWCLPEPVQTALDRFKEEHQLPLALSFISAVFTGAAGLTVFIANGPWQLFVSVCSIGAVLTVGAYLLAIERTEEYAEQLRTAVDLYHQELEANWAKPTRDDAEADWFTTARSFVLLGPDAPEPVASPSDDDTRGRNGGFELHFWSLVRAQIGRQFRRPHPAVQRDQNARGGQAPTARESRLVSLWEDVICHVRLIWVATAIAGILIAACTATLHHRTTEVLVASAPANAGERIAVAAKVVPARDVSRDVLTAHDPPPELYATADISEGAPLTPQVARPASDLLHIRLPVTEGTAPATDPTGRVVQALISPCGTVLKNATVTEWTSTSAGPPIAALLVPADQTVGLEDCKAASVTVLVPAQ